MVMVWGLEPRVVTQTYFTRSSSKRTVTTVASAPVQGSGFRGWLGAWSMALAGARDCLCYDCYQGREFVDSDCYKVHGLSAIP